MPASSARPRIMLYTSTWFMDRSVSYVNHGSVCRKSLVRGQQNEFLDLRLCDQHPIKKIAVAPRKQGDLPGVRGHQWQALEGFGGQPIGEVNRQPQFAHALLDPDLPKRDGTDEHSVLWGADRLPGLGGERRTGLQPPEQEVCVE